ncbi:MAG: MerR family transcriptional regulator [Candidatus Nanoarchaeia archaeon]
MRHNFVELDPEDWPERSGVVTYRTIESHMDVDWDNFKAFYRPKEVCEIFDIAYSTLARWDKTGFIRPLYRRKGKFRFYVMSDLIRFAVSKDLKSVNMGLQRRRPVVHTAKALMSQMQSCYRDIGWLVEDKRLIFSGDNLQKGEMRYAIQFP